MSGCEWGCDDGWVTGYGFFLGGDPREFTPDEESCRPDEIAAHKAACARWDAGQPQDEGRSGQYAAVTMPSGEVATAIVCGHSFGIGVYRHPCPCREPPALPGAGGENHV